MVQLLQDLYGYFGKSPKRKLGLRKVVHQRNKELQARLKNAPVIMDPDDAMFAVYKALWERHKLPPRIVLTRWLCCREAVHTAIVGRESYCVYFAEEAARVERLGPGAVEAKAPMISMALQDNSLFAWAHFLEDVLPVLTNMNCLFQSDLPIPHLLYDKVQSAKAEIRIMCGQTPRDDVMPPREVTDRTPFGAFAETFIAENSNGRVQAHGSPLTPADILSVKRKWATCLWFMHGELDERFPPDSMEVYELLRVVDPANSHSALVHEMVAGVPKAEVVKKLLHIFELPLYDFSLQPQKVANSFASYLSSTIARSTYQAIYAFQKKSPSPTVIYQFYGQLLHHRELRDWALFALFLLIFPTGNAISERGFSALNATATKGRYSLSVNEALATMIISFNGPTYEAFKSALDKESMAEGKEWWGFVPSANFNR